jgi:hypothetical protein
MAESRPPVGTTGATGEEKEVREMESGEKRNEGGGGKGPRLGSSQPGY